MPSIVNKTPVVRFSCFAGHSASDMDTPDIFLLQGLSRFAKPMRWTLVAREIAAKQPQPRRAIKMPSSLPLHLLLEYAAVSITTAWCRVPTTFRIHAYRCLWFLGVHLYGPSCSLKVQRLPFGMYLKTARAENHEALANEYGALQLVRRHTQIPAPRPLDLVSDARTSYLLTSRVPGLLLGACIDTLSGDEVSTLVCDLQTCLGQLRAIAKEVAPSMPLVTLLVSRVMITEL